jgi:uncharacterized protein YqeY
MGSLQQRLQDDVKLAMKAGRKEDLEVLRVLLSDVKKILIDGGAASDDAGDDLVLKVLQKAVKTRQESAEAFTKGGRADLVEREKAQIAIVQRYLPAGASEAEIAKVVDAVIAETGASGKAAMGKVIKEALARLAGRAEGGAVSKVVAARLQ